MSESSPENRRHEDGYIRQAIGAMLAELKALEERLIKLEAGQDNLSRMLIDERIENERQKYQLGAIFTGLGFAAAMLWEWFKGLIGK